MNAKILCIYTDYTVSDCEIEGKKLWYKKHLENNLLHRLDGPAREWADGEKEYFVEGKRQRLDGPAIEYASGDKEYLVNGVDVTDKIKDLKQEDTPKYLRVLSL